MLRVQCPHCQRTYRTELEACGRTAVCSKCNQTFKIGESRPPFEWKPTSIAEDSWIGVVPPEERKELRHCMMCEAPLPPQVVVCPACGTNQVTGLVRRPKVEPQTQPQSIGSIVPVRMILLLAVLAGIGAIGYWGILAVTRSAVLVTDQVTDQAAAMLAAKLLRDGEDEPRVAARLAGKVTDANLPHFVGILSSGDANLRRAAALLIGSGKARQLAPVVEWARAGANPDEVLRVLDAIGARRLVELSGDADAAVRGPAAEAMCALWQLNTDPDTLQKLAAPTAAAEKIARANELCRPWPEANGVFEIWLDEAKATLPAAVEQIGKTFYLRIGGEEFRSRPGVTREFWLPIESWCAATGSAIDPAQVRDMLGGTVRLASPLGVDWEGTLQLVVRRPPHGSLPGFLPIARATPGQQITATVRLTRSGR